MDGWKGGKSRGWLWKEEYKATREGEGVFRGGRGGGLLLVVRLSMIVWKRMQVTKGRCMFPLSHMVEHLYPIKGSLVQGFIGGGLCF